MVVDGSLDDRKSRPPQDEHQVAKVECHLSPAVFRHDYPQLLGRRKIYIFFSKFSKGFSLCADNFNATQ